MPGKRQPGLSWVMWDVLSPKTKRGYLVKYVLMKVIDSLYAFFFFLELAMLSFIPPRKSQSSFPN